MENGCDCGFFFWKPCWQSVRMLWDSRKDDRRESMIFSMSLEMEESREIGL